MAGSGTATGAGVVGIADLKVLRHSGQLITHGLGSCVAVLGYDALREVGGLLHFVSPAAAKDPQEATRTPATYADSGIKALLWALQCAGARKEHLRFHLVGGACMSGGAGVLNIGKKNVLAARKALWSAGGLVESEHVGGTASRTVRMDVASGQVQLRLGTGELINL